ncbi:hypothetical protein EVAR_57954_1 [Eumeta japonica]|uniref:Uncharacterized protein n=1 Tax=Eumeta variegata TaxID=151549 RepID=A0A4C1XVM5_EUMVA|nr:hypothetical protein EVAR_57954_1 [Eumeta japonica]
MSPLCKRFLSKVEIIPKSLSKKLEILSLYFYKCRSKVFINVDLFHFLTSNVSVQLRTSTPQQLMAVSYWMRKRSVARRDAPLGQSGVSSAPSGPTHSSQHYTNCVSSSPLHSTHAT